MRIQSALLLIIVSGIARAQSLEGAVTVFFSSDHPLPAPVLSALQREADAAVLPSLIRLSWQSQSPSENPSVDFRVAIMRFRGECRPGARLSVAQSPGNLEALGETHTVDGEVLPFSEIQCDAARRFLERDLRTLSAVEQDEALGRALGRVVAHELYHILLRTRSHGRTGLGRPKLSRAELLTPRHSFGAAEQQRLAEAAGDSIGSDATGR